MIQDSPIRISRVFVAAMKSLLFVIAFVLAGCASEQKAGSAGAAVSSGQVPEAPDYVIQLVRKSTVGEHYRVVASGKDEQSLLMSIDGQDMPRKEEVVTVELIANCEVLALTPSGREMKTKFTVVKATRSGHGQLQEFLGAGTEVIAERVGDKTQFSVAGRPVDPAIGSALDTAGVDMSSDDSATDDDIFGTKMRKRVGDSWPINATAAAADLAKMEIMADPSKISGSTTLTEVVKQGTQDLLKISGSLAMQGVALPCPPGFAVQSSEMSADYSGLFPVDLTKAMVHGSMGMQMKVVISGVEDGKQVLMTMTKKRMHQAEFSSN